MYAKRKHETCGAHRSYSNAENCCFQIKPQTREARCRNYARRFNDSIRKRNRCEKSRVSKGFRLPSWKQENVRRSYMALCMMAVPVMMWIGERIEMIEREF